MNDWAELQRKLDAEVDQRLGRLERMLEVYRRRGMMKHAAQIPRRICRLKSRLATINLNSFRHNFQRSA